MKKPLSCGGFIPPLHAGFMDTALVGAAGAESAGASALRHLGDGCSLILGSAGIGLEPTKVVRVVELVRVPLPTRKGESC